MPGGRSGAGDQEQADRDPTRGVSDVGERTHRTRDTGGPQFSDPQEELLVEQNEMGNHG